VAQAGAKRRGKEKGVKRTGGTNKTTHKTKTKKKKKDTHHTGGKGGTEAG